MKFFFVGTPIAFAVVAFALAGCASTPYKIVDRKVEGPFNLVTSLRVDVPTNATDDEMQSWCGTLTQQEKGEGIVNIEFLEEGAVIVQKGFCLNGKFVGKGKAGFETSETVLIPAPN